MKNFNPGTTVANQYRIETKIESGGFSTVWKARDENNDASVVVKTPNDAINDAIDVREAFEREHSFIERFAEAIQPSSLARQLCSGTKNNEEYVVYEYLEGQSLESSIESGQITLGMSAIENIFVPICHAIAYLHLNGYLYLDLKPENIFLTEENTPVLVDFNMVVPRESGGNTIVHQDGYKPPEQAPENADTSSISARSDVYSCGAFLYQLLTEKDPPTEYSKLPMDPRESNAPCPNPLAPLVKWATNPVPEKRPRDALEMLGGLIEATSYSGFPVGLYDSMTDTHVPVGPSTQFGRTVKRGPRPEIWFSDSEPYVSPVQFQLTRQNGANVWCLKDEGTNGTYVISNGTVQYLLSKRGYKRIKNTAGVSAPNSPPPTETTITNGDIIRPVSEDYHREFEFRTG